MKVALSCERVSKSFQTELGLHHAVHNFNLTVSAGEFVTLLGPSGCGKTTTLRLIAGLERPDRGKISIGTAIVCDDHTFLSPERRSVGMVFQEYALFPHLTAAANVAFGVKKQEDSDGRVADLLEMVGLASFADRYPHELSGGQQQRVALARALAPAPGLLLLDEPFSNLDTGLRATLRHEVRRILQQAGETCIFVTHDQQEAFSLSNRVAVMLDGRLSQIGPPAEVYLRPETRAVANFVTEANYLPGEATGLSVDCLFGRLPLARPQRGAVDVMIHPEQIGLQAILPDDQPPSAVPVVVQWNEYYGHDQRIGLQTAQGQEIVARSDSISRFPPQSVWHARVTAPVLAFPRASS